MEKSKDKANLYVVKAGAAVGACAGYTASTAAATAVAASTVPVTTVFAGAVFTSGSVVTASPALILLAAHPVCAVAIGTAALAVGGYRVGKWLLGE